MSILITQTCDRCDTKRGLQFGFQGQPRALHDAAQLGGWREVQPGKHMCGECITDLVKAKP